MKSYIPILFAVLVLGFIGCAGLDSLYDKEVIQKETITPVVLTTEEYVQQLVNGALQTKTNVVTVTNFVSETTYQTNLVPRESVTSTIGLGTTAATPVAPWAPIAGGVLSLLYAGYANFRNRRTQHTFERVGGTLIDSTDQIRHLVRQLPDGEKIDEQIKEILIASQRKTGTKSEVNRLRDAVPSPE